MATSNGPNLGLIVDGGLGESHYNALMARWRALDSLIMGHVKSYTLTTPPVNPNDGDTYIIPSGSTGVWAANTNKITRYSAKQVAWEFFTPKDGWTIPLESTSTFLRFNGSNWIDAFAHKADLVAGKVPADQLPSYVDDIVEFANLASFPVTGESGKIYVAIDTGYGYRWSGSTYIKVSQPLDEMPQLEAETGTSTVLRAITALRIRQAVTAWWESVKGALVGPIVISANSSSDALRINQTGSGNALVVEDSASPDSTPFVITASGGVVVGSTTQRNIGVTPAFTVEGVGSNSSASSLIRNSADANPPSFRTLKTRGSAVGAFDSVVLNDSLFQLICLGADGANAQQAATITVTVDGAPSTSSMPGRISFATTPVGSLTSLTRLTIDSSGHHTPGANKTQDIGSQSLQWRYVYSDYLQVATSITEAGRPVLVDTDVGTDDNQIPLNAFLGGLAYMNPERIVLKPQPSVTPAGNGDMIFELTNNTTLVVRVRGSDGVVRSSTLTLA